MAAAPPPARPLQRSRRMSVRGWLAGVAITVPLAGFVVAPSACSQTMCVEAYEPLEVVMTEELSANHRDVVVTGCDATAVCAFRRAFGAPCVRYTVLTRRPSTCTIEVRFEDRPSYTQRIAFVDERDEVCGTPLIRPEVAGYRVPDFGPARRRRDAGAEAGTDPAPNEQEGGSASPVGE